MIETTGLRKSYQSRKAAAVDAVRGLDLSVAAGEIYGFLGPNGAGKTTTLRMLATLIRPDGGSAVIAGADLRADPAGVRRRIGYVAQGGGTADTVTGREELVMQARMYGSSKAEALKLAEGAVGAFELGEFADRACQTYSGGQRRRVDIALGVIHQPAVLFLDEPTVGLDPASRAGVWEEIRRLRAEGMTVFVTTHYLDEADALCDRIGIIDHGGIVAEGTPEELKQEVSGDVVVLSGLDPEDAAKALADAPYLHRTETPAEGGLRLYVRDGATAIPQLLPTLAAAGLTPATVQLQRPSLDDVFLARTGRSLT
ncbi:ATP-binding cassette domain-containing protein [Kitasatospora sp. NPDC051853]|uniref:ATP-binding cassette domain-containing protein n=1 Tax=Kitasatospora sp. NPDC051853 TaxID=3364058 RepID=UPI0037BD98B4